MAYNVGDWILAGWTIDDLARKAILEKWTPAQVIDWCIDHADDEKQRTEVAAMPGADELAEMITAAIINLEPSLPAICAAGGYFRFVDTDRLLTDLQKQPGCSDLKKRTLQGYLYGQGKVPAHVISALAEVLCQPVEVIVRAVTR